MGTQILVYNPSDFSSTIRQWDGASSPLVGFCVEQPMQVLERVWRDFKVHSYNGVELFEIYSRDKPRTNGLYISGSEGLRGTEIVGRIEDLIPHMANARLPSPATSEEWARAMRASTENSLGAYIESYRTEKHEENESCERAVKTLLDVMRVTQAIKNPSVKDLQELIRREQLVLTR